MFSEAQLYVSLCKFFVTSMQEFLREKYQLKIVIIHKRFRAGNSFY